MDKKYLPLTDVQRSYLYGRNKNLFLGGVSTHFYIEYRTRLDIKRFEKALNCVIAEQPSLRSYITSDAMQCFMNETPYYTIEEEDISDLDAEAQEKKILELRNTASTRIFELDKWPMFEFKAYKINNEEKLLLVDSDMMIMDGMSTEILIEGLHRCYNNPDNMDIIPFEVIEKNIRYIEAQREQRREADEMFWKEIIPRLPSGPQFTQIQNIKNGKFSNCERVIPKAEWDKIKEKLAGKHILPSVYVMAAYAKTLARWCRQKKITLNITISNRKGSDKEILKTIGDFTEVILVDFDFSDTSDCIEIAAATQKKISNYKKHRTFESSAIIREYSEQNNLQNRFPFPAVCTSMMFDKAGSKWEWVGERTYQISQTPQVVLDNQVSLKEGRLCIHWDYIKDCFSDTAVNSMQEDYVAELLGKQDEVQKKYDETAERYNQTIIQIPKTDLVKLFRQTVERFADKTAAEDENCSVSYYELDIMSDKIARYTINNYGAYKPIILKMSRHINAIAAMLGILKSGGYYIPVAEDIPKQRLSFIKEQSESVVIYDDNKINEILSVNQDFEPVDCADADRIAYVIYTSGSTGSPKGVVIKHDAVCNTIQDINHRFRISEKDSMIGISFFGFDLSVYDIFGTLACGGTLYLAHSAQDIYGIRELVFNKNITVWNTVPSIMELFINNLSENQTNDSLRVVMLSGDWISLGLPEKIKKYFPNADIYSLGGATEASIWSIYYPVKKVSPNWNSIPYGYPLANQTIWILDSDGRICPEGVSGEICIGGRGVASGYLNDEERTAKQFIKHDKLGDIYMTGDLGYLSENGYVVFMGRKDFQIKLNGYRIELGEIENCLLRCENVYEAIAEVKEAYGKKMICAYVTPKKNESKGNIDLIEAVDSIKTIPPVIPEISQEKYKDIQHSMDEYSLGIMYRLFHELTDENAFSVDELINSGKINERYRKISVQWADSLVENGYLDREGNGRYVFTTSEPSEINNEKTSEMESWNIAFDFLSECSEKLREVVSGKLNPMSLLFKDGRSDIADNLYGSNPVAMYYNAFVADMAKSFVKKSGRRVNILEVGAGVGATTDPVIKKISGLDFRYEFTDISEFFNDIAKVKFNDKSNIRYGILNIDEVPQTQGYQSGQFDMIIAANVLHDGIDVKKCLKNLRTLLNGEGILILLEVTESRHFHKISMGLMNGYSAYDDERRVKNNSPLLTAEEWKEELTEAGFSSIYDLTSDTAFSGGQSVFAALSGKNVAYPDMNEMYSTLEENVVNYMMPESIMIMDSFPYTVNGKIDRKSLPVCMINNDVAVEEYAAPETETEKLVAAIISETANLNEVSVTSDFVRIGIDSLKGITFITKLQENGIKISLSELYEYPNVRRLSAFLDERRLSEELLECGEI